MMKNKKILLIGSGNMANEYLKVLKSLNKNVVVVGRGESNILKLKETFPEFEYFYGGIDNYISNHENIPETAINTVNIDFLRSTSITLLLAGVKNLLIEKPGDITVQGLKSIQELSNEKAAKVTIAYNRRFYSSVMGLIDLVKEDGGVSSSHFEFTEWVNTIGPETHSKDALSKWVLSNSSHVIDTVFHIINKPSELYAKVLGENKIDWHSNGSIFIGHGISENNIPFTYHSNWDGPGRWSIEVTTCKRRFYLKPMEKLFVQNLNSVQINEVKIDDELDIKFKPGLYLQTKSFIDRDFKHLQSIEDQVESMKYYSLIAGY